MKPTANDCPVPGTEHNVAAWLGQAGLYRTSFDGERNCEQAVKPVSVAELFQLASKQVTTQLKKGLKRA